MGLVGQQAWWGDGVVGTAGVVWQWGWWDGRCGVAVGLVGTVDEVWQWSWWDSGCGVALSLMGKMGVM